MRAVGGIEICRSYRADAQVKSETTWKTKKQLVNCFRVRLRGC